MARQSPSPGDAGGITLAFTVALPFLFLISLPTLEAAHGLGREFLRLQKELREKTALLLTLRSVAATEWQDLRSDGGILSFPGVEATKHPSGPEELRLLLRREGTGTTLEVRIRPEKEVP